MQNVVGYVRISTNNQDLQRQKNLIYEYCDLHNLRVIKILSDQVSGATGERDGYVELLTLKKEEADIVIMTEVSRLSREDDIMEPLANINNILKKGIDIIFLDNNVYNTKLLEGGKHLDFKDIIILAVELKAAADERKKIVGRMMSGRKEKFESNDNMCIGSIPFGYKRVANPNYILHKTPKSLLVRNENAEIVQEIFRGVLSGKPVIQIAKELQAKGVMSNRGNLIQHGTVDTIVHNPIYKGEWRFSGKVIKGDAIISEEDWNKAQTAINANKIEHIAKGTVNFNPLRGIIKCPCGHSMYIIKNRTTGNPLHRQFRCATKKDQYYNQICNNGGTNVDLVFDAVWNAVKCSMNSQEFANRTNAEITKIESDIISIENQIESFFVKIKEREAEMRNITSKLIKTSNETLYRMMEEQFVLIENQKKELENSIERLKEEKTKKHIVIEELSKRYDEEISLSSDEEKAAIYKRILNKVTYYSEVMHRGFLVIDFKNGSQIIYMILTKKKPHVIQLPSSFKFNPLTRKVIVEFMSSAPSKTAQGSFSFSFSSYENEYDTVGIEKAFPEIMLNNAIYND